MLSATLGMTLIFAQSVVGGGHRAPVAVCCDACGVEKAALLDDIERLQHCPRWRDRKRAAHVLRQYDWRCHPEVAEVLATALLADCHEEVREEAAQSLTRLAPCVPVVHMALTRAACADPDHATRHWAKKALKVIGRGNCDGACTVCAGPAVVTPGTIVRELPVVTGPPVKVLPSPALTGPPVKVLPPPVDSSVDSLPDAIEPTPAPAPSAPRLEEPRLDPATGAKERPLRTVLMRLGVRPLDRAR